MSDRHLSLPRGLSRRRALQAGIIGGTAVWVAPTIDSLYSPAAAASNTGNCTGAAQTIDWSTFPTNGLPSSNAGFPYTVGTFGGTTVTIELIAAGSLVWGTGQSGVQNATQSGNFTGIFQLFKNLAPVGDTTIIRLKFDKAVRNLDFRLTDIDTVLTGGNNFVDQVTVAPFLNGVAQNGRFNTFGTPTYTPTGNTTATTTTRTGTAESLSNDNQGNLRIRTVLNQRFDRVDITYTSVQPSGTGTTQAIGITNISWDC
jgi:hypothetical protein